MKIPLPWIGLLIAGSFCLGSVAWADEKEKGERVTIDQLPAAAKATIQKETQGGKVKELMKETEGGELVYSAEIVKDGKEYEVHVGADGTVTKRGAKEEEAGDGD
jgi:uncharacterized membrane protein YkoI